MQLALFKEEIIRHYLQPMRDVLIVRLSAIGEGVMSLGEIEELEVCHGH
jgi:hypothetical protein